MCDKRQELITKIFPPSLADKVQELTSGSETYIFGPFDKGDLIRISALAGDIWYCAVPGQGRNIDDRDFGAPLAGGTFVDHEIVQDLYIAVALDDDSSESFVSCYVTGHAPGPMSGDNRQF